MATVETAGAWVELRFDVPKAERTGRRELVVQADAGHPAVTDGVRDTGPRLGRRGPVRCC